MSATGFWETLDASELERISADERFDQADRQAADRELSRRAELDPDEAHAQEAWSLDVMVEDLTALHGDGVLRLARDRWEDTP